VASGEWVGQSCFRGKKFGTVWSEFEPLYFMFLVIILSLEEVSCKQVRLGLKNAFAFELIKLAKSKESK